MAIEEYRSFFGLATNPNPLGGVPKGALVTANNVVLQRNGLVSPRPGFKDAVFTPTTGYTIKQLIPYDGELFAFQENGAGNWKVTRVSDSVDIDTTIDWVAAQIHSAEAGLNLYVTSADGVKRLESATDTTLENAGVPEALPVQYSLSSAGSPSFLENNKYVAFQVLYQKEINDRTLVGVPSLIVASFNNSGATRDIGVDFSLPEDINTGDVWQLYRTPIGDSEAEVLGQEPFLCYEAEITSAEISAGVISYIHTNATDTQGAFIYTAASQEGAGQANFRPPKAKDVALFKDMLFYANATERARQSLQLLNVDGAGLNYNGGTDDTSDALLIGATNITGLNQGNGGIGAYISDQNDPTTNGTYFAARTKITGASGAGPIDLTVDTGILLAAPGGIAPIFYFPTFEVGGITYYGAGSEDVAKGQFNADFSGSSPTSISYRTLVSLSNVINQDSTQTFYAYVDEAESGNLSLRIESRNPSGNSTVLRSSEYNGVSGNEDNTWLPNVNSSTGLTVDAEENVNRIYYSKLGEYEAVPLLNFFNLGSQRDKLLRIIPTSDAIHAFTTRGHYKIYGTSPTDLIVEEGDLTLDLLNPNLAVLHDDAVFAFTSQGFVAVTVGGVQNLSDATIDDLIRTQLRLLRPVPYAEGCSSSSKQTEDLVLFGIPADAAQTAAEKIYCYNTNTNGWTIWTLTPSSAIMDPATEEFYLGGFEDLNIETPTTFADQDYAVTISNVSSNTITINGGSGWTPVVGDAVVQGAVTARVTSVSSTTIFDVLQVGGTLTTGAATAYDAFTCEVAPTVEFSMAVSLFKHYRDNLVDFRNRQYLKKVTTSYTTDVQEIETSLDIDTLSTIPGDAEPKSLRLSIPRSIRRCSQLYPKITITEALSPFEFSGMTLIYEPMVGGEKGHSRGGTS